MSSVAIQVRSMAPNQDSTSPEKGGSQNKKGNTNVEIYGQYNYVAVGDGGNVSATTEETAAAPKSPQNDFNASEKFKNPNELLEELSKCRGPEKDELERHILQDILPCIESHAIKSASSCNDALELLARLCSLYLKSPKVASQSLKTLKRLLHLEFGKCDFANAHLIEAERILRQPFVDGSFSKELMHLQRSRVEVYNSIIALVLLYIAKGHLTNPHNKKDKEEIRQLVKNIRKSLQRTTLPKKDRWRFSMETALSLGEHLIVYKKLSQMPKLLHLCKEIMFEDKSESVEGKVNSLLEKLQRTEGGSVDLYVIMKMLHGKICKGSNSYEIVEWIIKKHAVFSKEWQRKDEDWHFALLACQILLHTINNHELSKAARTQAARCLTSLQGTKVYGKSVVIRNIIERYLLKTSFALDLESRKIVLKKRFNHELQDQLLVDPILMIKEICRTYEYEGLEITTTIYEDEDRLVVRGLYDYKPVAITIAIINPQETLYLAQDKYLSLSDKALQNETVILQRLDQTPNKYVPMVYAADTRKRPYHMICEYMKNEDLLHFLEVCKEQELPTYHQLLEICLGIAECMIFVHGNNIIHSQLRAEHVLLDDKFNVRLTGFSGAKIISESDMENGVHGERLGRDDPSVRYAAPECFGQDPLFSSHSDVWAFGVLMFVMFTCGGTPYANVDVEKVPQQILSGQILPKECMRDEIYSLIQMCLGQTRKERISFQKISELLEKHLASHVGQVERLTFISPRQGDEDEDEGDYEFLPVEEKDSSKVMNLEPNHDFTGTIKGSGSRRKQRPTSKTGTLADNSKKHLKKLKSLDHPNLVGIRKDQKTKIGRGITYENCKGENLRNFILHNDCTSENLIRFSAQLAEAMNYLHSKNIILCTLNAEQVMVVNSNQVKIVGLHFSRSVLPSYNEDNASSCVAKGEPVDPDMYRWCAKEVIQDNIFSLPGDIWSLSMTILEMFLCLSKDDQDAKPFSQYSNEEILNAIKKGCRPTQPKDCPDWVYVLITQCWCLHTSERASSLSLLDCLTQAHPWESYILQCWIEKHEIHENWPKIDVFQGLDLTTSLSRLDVEKSLSEEFAGDHTYEYQRPFWNKKTFSALMSRVTGKGSSLSRQPTPRVSSSSTLDSSPSLLQPQSSVSSLSSILTSSPSSTMLSLSSYPSTSSLSSSSLLSADSNSVSSRRSTLSSSSTTWQRRPSSSSALSTDSILSSRTMSNYSSEISIGTDSGAIQDEDLYDELPCEIDTSKERKYDKQSSIISTRTRSSTISLPLPPTPPKKPENILIPVQNNENGYKVKDRDDDKYDDINYMSMPPVDPKACSSRPRSASLPAYLSQTNDMSMLPVDLEACPLRPRSASLPAYLSQTNPSEKETLADHGKSSDLYQDLACSSQDAYMPLLLRTPSEIFQDDVEDIPYDDTVPNTVNPGKRKTIFLINI